MWVEVGIPEFLKIQITNCPNTIYPNFFLFLLVCNVFLVTDHIYIYARVCSQPLCSVA